MKNSNTISGRARLCRAVFVFLCVLCASPVFSAPETLYRDPANGGILVNTGVVKTRLHQLLLSDGAAVDSSLASKQPHATALDTLSNSSSFFLSLSPAVNAAAVKTLLSLAKGDVGLGNVDDTSDANKPVSTAQATAIALKVTANGAVVSATKTKITYDTKGLVTAGADATTADVADSTDRRYVTDAQRTVIQNTSGTNTGDQVISDATISTTDITTNNVSITKHGFAPKLPNDSTKYLNGAGAYTVPPDTNSGGTVTSFSAADLSPLFTTTESTVTTTPALSFTLSNAAAHTFFGNETGSTAAPHFVQPAFTDLSGTATNAQVPATFSSKTLDDTNTYTTKDGSFTVENSTTPTKKFVFDLSNITAVNTRTVNIPDANSTTAQAKASISHQWLSAMSAQGAFTSSQPAIADLSDAGQLATYAATTPASGITAWWATPTLANLKTAITDETAVGWNLLTLANPSAITFLKVAADNSVSTENAATHRTSLGATTVGGNLFTLSNPSAITFLKVAADNSVTTESASAHRTSLGLVPGTDIVAFNGALGTPASGVATNLTSIPAANLLIASQAIGDVLYASSTSAWSRLADVASGNVLLSGGVAAAPSWGKVTTSHTTGIAASGANTDITSITGSAASLSISGQTALLSFTGLAGTNRAKTVRDAADTILEQGGSYTPTGTWTNLTLVAPALGTPTSLVLTNATGSLKNTTAISARAYNSANQSISSGTLTIVTFDSERWDTDTIHSTSSNTGRLTATTAGVYSISANIQWASNATGNRELLIKLNGTTFILDKNSTAVNGAGTLMNVTTQYNLAAGDYVELIAFQDSGGSLNIVAGANYSPEFMMTRIP